ncbi:MAG: hypothetical protein OXN97_17085 [Bryobacterales bacterium]|nr:hypothetical protein [Bryobacterales bacterium]
MTYQQVENRLQQILAAMNEVDPLQRSRDFIAGLGIQSDIIDDDLA